MIGKNPRAMILAAGLGTRMRPLTNSRAKPALPVCGRPVISLLLELLSRHGVREVLINLHHHPDSIRDAVAADHPANLDITWSEEPVPLGTGGGIRRAADFLSETSECIVLAGDMLLDLDLTSLLARHRASDWDVTLILRADARGEAFGTIGLDDAGHVTRIGRRAITATPRSGLGPETQEGLFTSVRLFSAGALRDWPHLTPLSETKASPDALPFEDLRDWLLPRVEAGSLALGADVVSPSTSVWEPVGTPAEYLRVNFSPPTLPSFGSDPKAWRGDVRVGTAASPGVFATAAELPDDAVLDRCVVWEDAKVPAGFHGRDGVFAGDTFHSCIDSSVEMGNGSAQ
jgi:NDP-sugar pyrophosphorylase family protein